MVRTHGRNRERPHRNDADDDDAAREHRRRVAARRRHRHHEHHAGVGHRADARDRPAPGDRRARPRRAAAVPGRSDRDQPARRRHRHRAGLRPGAGRHVLAGMADGGPAERGRHRVRVRGRDRRVLRVLPGAESGGARSDRRAAVRITDRDHPRPIVPLTRPCGQLAAIAVLGASAASGSEAVQSTPARPPRRGGEAGAAARAGPGHRRDGRAEADAARDSASSARPRPFSTVVGPRADHRPADLGQLQGRRRRPEGPGAVHARSPAARSGAAAGAGEPRARHRRRRPTPSRRRSATRIWPSAASRPRSRSTRRATDADGARRDGRRRPRRGREREGAAAVRDDHRADLRAAPAR